MKDENRWTSRRQKFFTGERVRQQGGMMFLKISIENLKNQSNETKVLQRLKRPKRNDFKIRLEISINGPLYECRLEKAEKPVLE